MRVVVYRACDLTASIRDEITLTCSVAHNMDFSVLWENISAADTSPTGIHVLIYETETDKEILVAHAMVSMRTTRYTSPFSLITELRTGYIDAVSVLPKKQGQGYGSIAMRKLVDIMEENDIYDIGALGTEKHEFYKKLGWEVWKGTLGGISKEGTEIETPHNRGNVLVYRLKKTPEIDLTGKLSVTEQPGRYWD